VPQKTSPTTPHGVLSFKLADAERAAVQREALLASFPLTLPAN
jgi:hypothetical protein